MKPISFVLLLVVSYYCVYVVGQTHTTPYIADVFTGKCLYKAFVTKSPVVATFNSVKDYCDELWARFNDTARLPAFQQNNITWAYFFELADFTTLPNRAMLWSGSKTFSEKISDDYTTLEDTLTGYILDELWWCPASAENLTDFDTTTPCAFNGNVPVGYYGLAPVWREASRRFASGITGDVTVLLQSRINAADPNAVPLTFRNESIFATIELYALVPENVTSVVALYMPGDRSYLPIESCTNGTLLQLKAAVLNRFSGYPTKYFCFDDNKLILRICTDSTNEYIDGLEAGVDTFNELTDYANNFDFPTSQKYPECAMGILAYISGVDDSLTVFGDYQQAIITISTQLNDTLAQLNDAQTQLQIAQQKIIELEAGKSSIKSGSMKLVVSHTLFLLLALGHITALCL